MPKIVDHEQYRQELVEGCIQLFADRGYASLTMRDIAMALSVSTGTLYHYFSSKEALFEAAVLRATQQDLGAAASLGRMLPSMRGRLHALFSHVAANEARFVRELLVLLEFRHIHGTSSRTFKTIGDSADKYIAAIDEFLGTHDLAVARVIFMLINGTLIKRVFDGGRTPITEQVEIIARLLPPEAAPKRAAGSRK